MKKIYNYLKEKDLIGLIIAIAVVILIRTFIVTPVRVNGDSMVPSLIEKDILILKKYDNSFNRYDIVVVDDNVAGSDIIKRIIALPGEKIKCKDGKIYINNKKIDDQYSYGNTNDFNEVKLKKDEYFVMGDNREISLDSRAFGGVFKNEIKGTVDLLIYPFDKFGFIK